MDWEMSRGLKIRILCSLLIVVLLPFGFVYTMLFALNTVGVELLDIATDNTWNGRFYINPWLLAVVVAIGFALQYSLGERVALGAIGAKTVDGTTHPELVGQIDRFAQQIDIAPPSVAVSDSRVPNAFTVGRYPLGSTIVVTEGLLDTLSDEQLNAVLAHELAHVKNRDVTVMTLAYFLPTLTYLVAMAAFLVLKGLFRVGGTIHHTDEDGAKGMVVIILVLLVSSMVTLAISVLFWVGSFLLFRILSRYREYAADRGGAAITGNPTALASALEKIDQKMTRLPDSDLRSQDGGLEALYVAPIDTYQFGEDTELLSSDLFPNTHPPVRVRVKRLQELGAEVEQ